MEKISKYIDLLNALAKDLGIEIDFYTDRSWPWILVGYSWTCGKTSIDTRSEINLNTPKQLRRLLIHRVIRANIEMKNRINKQQKKLKEML